MHIDNDRQNPHYSNLKWGTQSENIEHMYKTNKQVRENDNLSKGANHYLAKKVKMLSIDGVFIQEFESISLAVEFLISNNITDKKNSESSIRACINGTQKTAYGYKWSSDEDKKKRRLLDEKDVIFIFTNTDKTIKELSELYNVSYSTIYDIKKGISYKNITEAL